MLRRQARPSTPYSSRLRRGPAPVLVTGFSILGLAVAAGPGVARAAVHASISTAAPAARSVTLVTGDRVTMRTVKGRTVYATTSASGRGVSAEHYQSASGDDYVIPAEATPYFGHGLDASLFDVSALLRDGLTSGVRIPVGLSFGAGVTPSAPPGVTLTSASGGYLTGASGARFAAGLRKVIGADVRAGRPAGTTALFGGMSSMRLATPGAVAPSTMAPHYALHTLQFNATDVSGAPPDAIVILGNTDSLQKENVSVPIAAGVGRIEVPSGDYAAQVIFSYFDDQGDPTAERLVTLNDFNVADTAGVTTTENVNASTASSQVSVTTPRPATMAGLTANWYRADSAGNTFSNGFYATSDGPPQAVYVNAQPAAKVGTSRYLVQWQGTGPSTGPRYQYAVAFGSDGIPGDETFKVQPSRLATVQTAFYADPAGDTFNSLVSGAVDPAAITAKGDSPPIDVPQPPGALTLYLGTADGGRWAQSYFTSLSTISADPVTFAPGHAYQIGWGHGPLAPSYGQHSGQSQCVVCAAGSTLGIGYDNVVGDGDPGHTTRWQAGGTFHLTVDQNGTQVYDQTGPTATSLTGVPTVPTTYREVFDGDLTGVPGVSQSTKTHTDLSFRYDPAHPGVALPAEDSCSGQSAGTPCWIQPVLSLQYCLKTDLTNTSDLSTQTMGLKVGHLSYDGQGSHAAITAASVAVSFDGGTTWQPASLTGQNGAYTATWSNPASADATKPELKVTATDAVGGSITQTVSDAYSIASSTH